MKFEHYVESAKNDWRLIGVFTDYHGCFEACMQDLCDRYILAFNISPHQNGGWEVWQVYYTDSKATKP